MPVVEVSYSRLQKLVGKASKKQISESLPFLGLDIESEDKDLVRVEYSPNRPDYSTDFGISLGLEGILGIKTGSIKLKIKKSKTYAINVKSNVSKIRPFVTGIVAKNGKIDDKIIKQLMAMQEDLHFGIGRKRKKSSIGIHDLDKICFPLTYTTTDRNYKFIPLNSKVEQTISEILQNTEVGQDYGYVLGNSAQVPIIVDSKDDTVSFPPIINADKTTVTTKTKNLFVEVTGINKEDAEDMLSVVATILQAAGFNLESVNISGARNKTPKLEHRQMSVSPSLINDSLGLTLNNSTIISSLKKSRLDATTSGKNISCKITPYRFDIFGPMDLTMVGLGYLEALNSSLTSKRILFEMTNREPKNPIAVLDSKSQEHTILRDSILPGLLENLSRNIHAQYPQKLFETGTVFFKNDPIDEKTNFAAVWANQDANFSEMKSILQAVLKTGFNLQIETKTATHETFEKGRTASILVDGKTVGIMGEINSNTIENYKIRVPVSGFEITLSGLIFD